MNWHIYTLCSCFLFIIISYYKSIFAKLTPCEISGSKPTLHREQEQEFFFERVDKVKSGWVEKNSVRLIDIIQDCCQTTMTSNAVCKCMDGHLNTFEYYKVLNSLPSLLSESSFCILLFSDCHPNWFASYSVACMVQTTYITRCIDSMAFE